MEFMDNNLENDTLVICCEHVFHKIRKIRYVVHIDNDWQFLCGYDDAEIDNIHHVGYGHLKIGEPTLVQIEKLPEGCFAFRNASDPKWSTGKIQD